MQNEIFDLDFILAYNKIGFWQLLKYKFKKLKLSLLWKLKRYRIVDTRKNYILDKNHTYYFLSDKELPACPSLYIWR